MARNIFVHKEYKESSAPGCAMGLIGLMVIAVAVAIIQAIVRFINTNLVIIVIVLALFLVTIAVTFFMWKNYGFKFRVLVSALIGLSLITGVLVYSYHTGFGKVISDYINARVTTDLNVREGPSSDTRLVGTLKEDVVIQVYKDQGQGSWVKIKYLDMEGFVNSQYIEIERGLFE
ncbi:MAG: SH3 domain-containing protein [Treponema sp.]|nr:SH3 domain-containing protein [Treponema sp.]